MRILSEELNERRLKIFYEHVHKTEGCWIWTGAKHAMGYGCIGMNAVLLAHRVSYYIFKGIDPKELSVLHKCDNRLCINPDHLFLGTQRDNMIDMINKGRDNWGEWAHKKLNVYKVKQIKQLLRDKVQVWQIAKQFNVSGRTISSIKSGQYWSHVN